MPHPRPLAKPLLVALTLACAAPAHAQVFLRGESNPTPGEVTAVSGEGVEVKAPGEPVAGLPRTGVKLIAWDRIREVRGKAAADAAPFAKLADQLWRARTRLERGDVAGALPLFEAAHAQSPGISGPSGALLAEGLLRVRLASGRSLGALWPMLDWSRIHHAAAGAGAGRGRKEQWFGGVFALPAVLDNAKGVSPRVAPIFSTAQNAGALRVLAESDQWAAYVGVPGVTGELAAVYRAAARFEALGEAKLPEPPKSGDDTVAFAHEILRARAGSGDERAAARSKLRRRIDGFAAMAAADPLADGASLDAPPANRWMEAWARAAIGASLLREPGIAERRLGVIELLHVPARFADSTPELAALALAEAARTLDELGDATGAARLRSERARLLGEREEAPPIEEPATETQPDPNQDPLPPSGTGAP